MVKDEDVHALARAERDRAAPAAADRAGAGEGPAPPHRQRPPPAAARPGDQRPRRPHRGERGVHPPADPRGESLVGARDSWTSGCTRRWSPASSGRCWRWPTDPSHPMRRQFDDLLTDWIVRLQESPEAIARADAVKQQLFDHPTSRRLSASLWEEVKRVLDRQAEPDRRRDAGRRSSAGSSRWPTARWRTRRCSPSSTAGSWRPCSGSWSSTATRWAGSSSTP